MIRSFVLNILIACTLSTPGCAHRHKVRAIHAIEERCVAELDRARTTAEAEAIRQRCTTEIELVSR